jgi:uncharacterized membrane protein YfcA
MRLKLVFIASFLSALIGAGGSIAIVLVAFNSFRPLTSTGLVAFSTILLPVITCLLASIFVYRHTARRRKLQAALTAILSIILSLAAFVVASIVSARLRPLQPTPLQERTVT